tara:strand:+ start:894 stop:1505 length:612 start_codon:yes stop_codon:yes gene_type:complete
MLMQRENKTCLRVEVPDAQNTVKSCEAGFEPREKLRAAPCEDSRDMGDLHEVTTVNAVILIVVSSAIGSGLAVVSAILGSSLLMSFFVYLVVSILLFTALFGLAYFAARPMGSLSIAENALDLVECETTETVRVLSARNRWVRIWWLIIICAFILSIRLTDEVTIQIAVCAVGVLVWVWLLKNRSSMKSQRIVATCKRASSGK